MRARGPSSRNGAAGLEHDLDAFLLLVTKHRVSLRRLIQREPVRDTKLGSMRPCWINSSKGRKYRCTWVCPDLIVRARFTTEPNGILSKNPP